MCHLFADPVFFRPASDAGGNASVVQRSSIPVYKQQIRIRLLKIPLKILPAPADQRLRDIDPAYFSLGPHLTVSGRKPVPAQADKFADPRPGMSKKADQPVSSLISVSFQSGKKPPVFRDGYDILHRGTLMNPDTLHAVLGMSKKHAELVQGHHPVMSRLRLPLLQLPLLEVQQVLPADLLILAEEDPDSPDVCINGILRPLQLCQIPSERLDLCLHAPSPDPLLFSAGGKV